MILLHILLGILKVVGILLLILVGLVLLGILLLLFCPVVYEGAVSYTHLDVYKRQQKWYVSVEQKEQWEAALSQDEVDGIYCSISMYPGKNFLEEVLQDIETVSYTHLDVYKRQSLSVL